MINYGLVALTWFIMFQTTFLYNCDHFFYGKLWISWLKPHFPWLKPRFPWLKPRFLWLKPCFPWLKPHFPWLKPRFPWLKPHFPWLKPHDFTMTPGRLRMVCDLGRVARSSWIAGIKVEPLISCWVASGISWDFMGKSSINGGLVRWGFTWGCIKEPGWLVI